MSQFTVCRSWNGYCLLLDDDRIAGGKPDYHEGNVIYEWRTRDTYGSVDELQAENAKLRERCAKAQEDRERMFRACVEKNQTILRLCGENAKLRELCRRLFNELYTLIDDNYSDVCKQYERSDVQPFYDELRELGIEVEA